MDGQVEFGAKINKTQIEKDAKGIKNTLRNIGDHSVINGLSKIGATLTGVSATINMTSAALKKIRAAFNELSEAYEIQRAAEIKLENAAKNNPYLNSSSVKRLEDFASAQQELVAIGDEKLLPYIAHLGNSGRTEAEIMNIMTASLDLAAEGTMDLGDAVKALNLTYSGQLGRLGMTIPALKDLTEEELKNGRAIDFVAKQYAGNAKRLADELKGHEKLKNAIGDVKEEIGASIEQTLNPWYAALARLVSNTASALKQHRELRKALEDLEKGNASASQLDSLIAENNYYLEEYQKAVDRTTQAFRDGKIDQETYTRNLENLNKQYEIYIRNNLRWTKQKEEQQKAEDDANKAALEEKNRLEKEQEIKEKTAAAEKKRIDFLAKNEEARKKAIEQLKLEAELKGEEADDAALLDIYTRSYISMLTDSEGLVSAESKEAKELLAIIEKQTEAVMAKIKAEEDAEARQKGTKELEEQIKNFDQDMQRAADEAKGIVKNQYDAAIEMLDEEYKAIVANKYLEENEKLRLEKEFEAKRQEILDARDKVEHDNLIKKLDEATETEETYWDRYVARNEEIADLRKEINESEILSEQEKYDAMAKLDEEYLKNRKQLFADIATEMKGYTDQAVSLMKDASDIMLNTVQNQSTAEIAALEEKYKKGEIGEEEYNEKVARIKKDAAKQQYRIELWQWGASILQATANIAQGVTKAIAQGGIAGLITGALVGAAGAVQVASIIASKPTPPAFSTGGIVGGSSLHGDNIAANLNSREMVMNMGQQKALWDFINGGSTGHGAGTQVVINNSASNIVSAQPRISKDKIEVLIDARVNESLKKGRYGKSLAIAEQEMTGDFWGI